MRKSIFILVVSMLVTILILSLFTYVSAKTAEELLQTPGLTAIQRAAIAEAIAKGNTSSFPQTIKGMLEWRDGRSICNNHRTNM